jgi:hypothetical protein
MALYGLLLLVILSPFLLISSYIGIIISYIIQVMNHMMEYLAKYRFAVLDELNPGLIEIILVYGMIWFMYEFYQTPNKKHLFGGLLCVLLIGMIQTLQSLLY